MLTTSSGKHLEDVSHAHIVSLMYKLITSAKDNGDLSVTFDRDRGRRQRGLTNRTNLKGIYHVRIMLKDIFGFAEHHEKAIFGLGYKLTLPRNRNNSVLKKANAIPLVELKLKVLNGVYHIILRLFPKKLF